jgi:hypothetical protein
MPIPDFPAWPSNIWKYNFTAKWFVCWSRWVGAELVQIFLLKCIFCVLQNRKRIVQHILWRLSCMYHSLLDLHLYGNTLWKGERTIPNSQFFPNKFFIKQFFSVCEKFPNILQCKMKESTIQRVYKSLIPYIEAWGLLKYQFLIVEHDCRFLIRQKNFSCKLNNRTIQIIIIIFIRTFRLTHAYRSLSKQKLDKRKPNDRCEMCLFVLILWKPHLE